MSRTNTTVPWRHWNIKQIRMFYGAPWSPYRGEFFIDISGIGNEMYDLRFYAGCKRQPQVVHKSFNTRGRYCSKIYLGPRIAASYANQRRRRTRASEREYEILTRDLWNAGDEVDDLIDPRDSRHGAILWDIW